MLKIGKYKTKRGLTASIVDIAPNGNAVGWIYKNLLSSPDLGQYPGVWDSTGRSLMGFFEDDLYLPPPTITIPETTLPEPMRIEPTIESKFYLVSLGRKWNAFNFAWCDDVEQKKALFCGLCHRTREAAQQWADFLNNYAAGKP